MKELNYDIIDSEWVLNFIRTEFEEVNENITPLKILSKLGIGTRDQIQQLKYKKYRLRLKKNLKELEKIGKLEMKLSRQDTLGIKENSYYIKV